MSSRRPPLPLLLLAAAVAAGSCDDPTAPALPAPAAVAVVAGDSQAGVAGEALAEPLVVRVSDARGEPVRGQPVRFQVTEGGGSIAATAAATDTAGDVEARWTLGVSTADSQRAEAHVLDRRTSATLLVARFMARPLPGPPAAVTVRGGSGQSAAGGQALPDSLVARVTDRHGNPVPGVVVRWAVAPGGGSVAPASALTDSAGEARAAWVLGSAAGAYTATATVAGLAPATWSATASSDAPIALAIAAGDAQTATVGSTLPEPLAVRLTFASTGEPVSGRNVSWTVIAGGGAVTATSVTDANGLARAQWTLGTAAGVNAVRALVEGSGAATFTATGTPDVPARVEKLGGDGQSGTVGSTLPEPLVVRVTDRHGNAVAGAAVTWGVDAGGGSVAPATVTTAADGRASTTWTLGPEEGTNRVAARVVGAEAATFTATARSAGADVQLRAQLIVSGLASPVHLAAPPGDGRLFIVEQPGRIRIVKGGQLLPTPFLDITDRVRSGGEQGLLSVVFHPQYAANGYFYVNYTEHLRGDTRVERYRVSTNPDVADVASAKLILAVGQPYANHNGGLLEFGPDGMLYVGMGDGGAGGDPHGYGQDRSSLLGKLLRIDVDRGDPYAIPPDNPFAAGGGRPEIWATGLRNPWRWSFDRPTNRLYMSDVGQGTYEEVDVVGAEQPGLNYGWNIMEGSRCYAVSPCDPTGLVLPTLEYSHAEGCSITGGYVYRGRAIPEIVGHYFYSDYCLKWLRSFRYANGAAVDRKQWLDGTDLGNVTSFGVDAEGELYIVAHDGRVHKLVRAP